MTASGARSSRWREPPIVFQILLLLTGGLVVAQLVTLLLTLVFPPAPPAQHDMAGIVAALHGQAVGADRLIRTVQAAPPDVSGKGWFTSTTSRHALAARLGTRDDDVRLAFYAPLPFAGITAPPSSPPPPLRAIAWAASPDPLPSFRDAIVPVALVLTDGQPGPPQGGGIPGQGFPRGGAFPDGGFPGASFPGGGSVPDRGAGRGERGGGSDGRFREDRGIQANRLGASSRPSPSDLDRQPIAPPGADRPDAENLRRYSPPPAALPLLAAPRALEVDQPSSAASPVEVPARDRPDPSPPVRTPQPEEDARRTTTVTPQQSMPAPAMSAPRSEPASREPVPTPLPIHNPSRALFGLAQAPFLEGDFVAAWRRPDGRWVVVQPEAAPFPNAWQRRIMLWFAIAFGIVTPFGWLFARHIVRPIARFTDVAERLGRDPSAGLVTLEGPAEIGRAARAFNVMQGRLRSFVDDRTAMVGAISHDLRTPLTRLRFRIEEVDEDRIRDGMIDEVEEMEAMIASVLDFIRDASTPNVRERVDLGLLLDDVAQNAALVGHSVVLEKGGSAVVEADALGMRRLISNLVENAVKYGERARLRLDVEGEMAIARILDDGPGIAEEEIERAFEPFYRTPSALQSHKGGTGLGLAVCRSIARAHGGDVRLHRSGEGFVAEMRVPLAHRSSRLAA